MVIVDRCECFVQNKLTPVGKTNVKRYEQMPTSIAIAIDAQVNAVAQSVSAIMSDQPRRRNKALVAFPAVRKLSP